MEGQTEGGGNYTHTYIKTLRERLKSVCGLLFLSAAFPKVSFWNIRLSTVAVIGNSPQKGCGKGWVVQKKEALYYGTSQGL